ncbi:hypothetical protein K505DRAFT_54306 [Melanomma pulvis-pyrius CBS 109.77]|uniref:Uncharacterized protein n=1 Tax=Melanomma pulvis-pyrius CBS 109.77 TaxID=1314802 RepID=A0A6A6X881_9PLEO|nr:hypothetical protein K505DRAFT_54306 [Melanomma pulvis-pyrius CBS 109.77]
MHCTVQYSTHHRLLVRFGLIRFRRVASHARTNERTNEPKTQYRAGLQTNSSAASKVPNKEKHYTCSRDPYPRKRVVISSLVVYPRAIEEQKETDFSASPSIDPRSRCFHTYAPYYDIPCPTKPLLTSTPALPCPALPCPAMPCLVPDYGNCDLCRLVGPYWDKDTSYDAR